MSDEETTSDIEDIDLEGIIGDACRSLVADDANRAALVAMFLAEPGVFHDLIPLIEGRTGLVHSFEETKATTGCGIHILWQSTPGAPGEAGEGWALLVFYSPEWNGVIETMLIDRRAFLDVTLD